VTAADATAAGRPVTVHEAGQRPRGLGLTELVTRRELLSTLVERQARLRVKRTLFGIVWPVVSPMFLLALYLFVFGSVFDVKIHDYGVYLLVGLLPWTFLVQSVHDSLQSISFEPDLVRRAPFPLHFLPMARVAVMTVPFLGLLVASILYLGLVHDRGIVWSTLPVIVLPVTSLILLVTSISMLLALLDVFNRDFRYVLNNLLTVWFFLVPIVYHRKMVNGPVRTITTADPMRWIIDQFRSVLYDGHIDSFVAPVLTLAACCVVFVVSLQVFRRLAVDLAKEV
jgi:ABC-2 type transport system permease protein